MLSISICDGPTQTIFELMRALLPNLSSQKSVSNVLKSAGPGHSLRDRVYVTVWLISMGSTVGTISVCKVSVTSWNSRLPSVSSESVRDRDCTDISTILFPAAPVFTRYSVLRAQTPDANTPKETPLMKPVERSLSRTIVLTNPWGISIPSYNPAAQITHQHYQSRLVEEARRRQPRALDHQCLLCQL